MLKTIFSLALTLLIAFVMLAGGAGHLVTPEAFSRLVPPFLPPQPVVFLSGLWEIAIGLFVLWPKTRGTAALAFALLCIGYTPLHLWDLVRDDPVFTPLSAAILRLVVQAVFIACGFALWHMCSKRALTADFGTAIRA